MFSLVREQLTGAVEHIVTIVTNAMNVVVGPREFATQESTRFMFHKLLETIFVQLLVLHVVVFVFLCQ